MLLKMRICYHCVCRSLILDFQPQFKQAEEEEEKEEEGEEEKEKEEEGEEKREEEEEEEASVKSTQAP